MSIQENKMNWLVESYNNNSINYEIQNTNKDFGTIVCPTGYGKSGIVIKDIVYRINTLSTGKKLVVNISCPILKLTQQFFNDLFATLFGIYGKSLSFEFYMNSSDNGNNYNNLDILDINVKSFRKDFSDFVIGDTKIAIIASCHKSLNYYISSLFKFKTYTAFKEFADNTDFVTYLDEAHLFSVDDRIEYYNDEDFSKVDLKKLVRNSTSCYALSATPDKVVTDILNKQEKNIIHIHPIEAIKKNIIIPPVFHYTTTEEDCITADIAEEAYKHAVISNPNIIHKILITCSDSEELRNKRIELENRGYKVFSICCKYGVGTDETDIENVNISDFINEVDNYNEQRGCFVLHCKQLIQGIDIKSLTDTIIYNANSGENINFRKFIQIIGRILRPIEGERGLNITERIKKVGNVYFVNKGDFEDDLNYFFVGYYGIDMISYADKKYKDGKGDNEEPSLFKTMIMGGDDENESCDNQNYIYNELQINVEKFMKTQINKYKIFGAKGTDVVKNMFEEDKNKIYSKLPIHSFNCSDLLDNDHLLEEIEKLMKKYIPQTSPLF